MNIRLAQLRKYLLLSQTEFANQLDISRTTLSQMELGNYKINERTILAIISKFNVNEKWLRTGEGDMFNSKDVTYKQLFDIYDSLSPKLQQFLTDMAKKLLDIQNSDN